MSAAAATLTNSGNVIGTLGAFSANTFSIRDAGLGLVVTGPVNAGTGPLSLTLDGGALGLQGNLIAAGNVVTLVSGGAINQTAAGITAALLTGSSTGGASLTSTTNAVPQFGGFTNSGAGGVAFTDSVAIMVPGTIDAGTGNLTLTANGVDLTGPDAARRQCRNDRGGQWRCRGRHGDRRQWPVDHRRRCCRGGRGGNGRCADDHDEHACPFTGHRGCGARRRRCPRPRRY